MRLKFTSGCLIALGAICLAASSVRATVTIQIFADTLKTAGGAAMPTNGMVILVASTTDTNFSGPTPTSFVSGDDIEVARFDLSSPGTAGQLGAFAQSLSLTGSWTAGDPLAIYWFPTLTTAASAPGSGTSYGFFHDNSPNGQAGSATDGSDPWYTPNDGASLTTLIFFTSDSTDNPGSNPSAAGLASNVVDRLPVANTDTYARGKNFSVKIRIADLLTNDTDPDGDTLSVSGVTLLSTNNVTLTMDATNIYYPSNAPNVTDKFTYTLSDGHVGGTSTGSVVIQIAVETGTNSVLALRTGVPGPNSNTISFAGIPGFQYTAQFATNVNGPWVSFSTNTAGTNGLWSVIDTTATNASRFYRTLY